MELRLLEMAVKISIHAAREGGDVWAFMCKLQRTHISIHAAREGGDLKSATVTLYINYFNPRRP